MEYESEIAKNFRNEIAMAKESSMTEPDFFAFIKRGLESPTPSFAVKEVFDLFFHLMTKSPNETPASIWRELAKADEFQKHGFELLFARLLWTFEEVSRASGKYSASHLLPESSEESNTHAIYRRWIAEYAYFANRDAHQKNESLSQELSQIIWGKDSPEPIDDSQSHYASNFAFVERSLQMQAEQLMGIHRSQIPAHLRLDHCFEVVECFDPTKSNENLVAKVKSANIDGLRIVKVPKPLGKPNGNFERVRRLVSEARMLTRIHADNPELRVAIVHSVSGPIFPAPSVAINDEELTARIRFSLMREPIFVEMAFYPDGTLEDRINRLTDKQVPIKECARICKEIAEILTALHPQSIQHRDIKPANFLCGNEKLFLADFGLSKKSDYSQPGDGNLQGTPLYMAPEQFEADIQLTVAVDVWAVGVILYQLLTGKLPFPGADRAEVRSKVRQASPEQIRTVRTDVDIELSSLCHSCLSKIPIDRPTASDLALRLSNWLKANGESTKEKKKYVWHPDLVTQFTRKRCVFLLLDLTSFSDSTYARIESILKRFDCTIYRIYRILGEYDALVRAYISHDSLEGFVSSIEEQRPDIYPISRVVECPVLSRSQHWYWSAIKADIEVELEVIVELERELDKFGWEHSPGITEAMNGGVLRQVRENSQKIIFFVFLKNSGNTVSRRELLHHVNVVSEKFLSKVNTSTLNTPPVNSPEFVVAENAKAVAYPAIYELTNESYSVLIKAEANNFFDIGLFVKQLSSDISHIGCMTMTCVAADQDIVGLEELSASTLSIRPTTRMIKDEFPELFERWRLANGKEDELNFAFNIIAEIATKTPIRFYKAVRRLLEKILIRCFLKFPLVDLYGRILSNISLSAQNVATELGLDKSENADSSTLLNQLRDSIARSCPANKPDFKERILKLTFADFEPIVKMSDPRSPDDNTARSSESIVQLVRLLEELWTMEHVFKTSFPGKQSPFVAIADYTSDEKTKTVTLH